MIARLRRVPAWLGLTVLAIVGAVFVIVWAWVG